MAAGDVLYCSMLHVIVHASAGVLTTRPTLTCSLHRSRTENNQNFMAEQLNINNLDVHFCFASDVTSAPLEKNNRSSHLSSRHLVTLIQHLACVPSATY